MPYAYVDKNNKVLHIVLSDEERLVPNEDGRILMTSGKYNQRDFKFEHIFGIGEEVREVSAEGLGIGSIYQDNIEQNKSDIDTDEHDLIQKEIELSAKEQQKEQLIKDLTSEYIYESKDFQDWLNKKLEEAISQLDETLDSEEINEEDNITGEEHE